LHSTLDPNTVPERPTWIEFDKIFNIHGLLIFHIRIRVDNYGTFVADLPVANPTPPYCRWFHYFFFMC
jgi:hypothetical protein